MSIDPRHVAAGPLHAVPFARTLGIEVVEVVDVVGTECPLAGDPPR